VPEKIGRLVIIGGGVIGTEIASVYAELGTQVTILEYLPYLLPVMDREIGRSLQMILKKRGIEVFCGAKVEKITRDEELHCHYVLKGKEQSVPADMVLVCTGRTADIDGLFEQKDMVAYDRGIVVDERFETSAEGIYAIGDVISGSIKLAHAASAQGRAAAAVIAGRELNINTAVIPACVYTSPEIAAVGLMPEDAKKAGIPVKTKKITMSANGRTMIADGERGFIRIIYGEDNVLLGAILMCERASDIVGMYTQAIVSKMTVEQLASAVMPHPSFVEASGELFASAE
jgi:dihydrolipoamide dehydrogenase